MSRAAKITLMEVCGTHTMAIGRFGIKKLLPDSIRLISGPGCPVCVSAQSDIDRAIAVVSEANVIMTTFGDMMRVPGKRGSFLEMKSRGADIRIVYSPLDSLTIAHENPHKKVVFMGVGFETTSPTVASTLIEAKRQKVNNFFVLCSFKLLFPALEALSASKEVKVDGFICPGHVSVITGTAPYKKFASRFKKPCVITGFEENDIIQGIKRLVDQVYRGECRVEIEYKRAVTPSGNKKALKVLNRVFKPVEAQWRGLGTIARSGLGLKKEFQRFSAEKHFQIKVPASKEPKGCICGEVLQGIHSPKKCKLFKKKCTPRNPVGPCMVSSEGTCASYYKYGE